MAIHHHLRPDLDQAVNPLPLYITGVLSAATPNQAYESRLQINNQIGSCKVISVSGSTLPQGSKVYTVGDEIVVSWPAYAVDTNQLADPGFESGSISGWSLFRKGEVSSAPGVASASNTRPYSGTYSALWRGNKGNGHAGGVECIWLNNTLGSVEPTQRVNASAMIALDDTGSSQNRGNCRLTFYNDANETLQEFTGNTIRGNNSKYRQSSVSGVAPIGSKYCRVGVWTTANASEGSGVRFDNVVWDLPENIGTNISEDLYITITIQDSAGRTATWSGYIIVSTGSLINLLTYTPAATGFNPYSVLKGGLSGWSVEYQGLTATPLTAWSSICHVIEYDNMLLAQTNGLQRSISGDDSENWTGILTGVISGSATHSNHTAYDGSRYVFTGGGVMPIGRSTDFGAVYSNPTVSSSSRANSLCVTNTGRLLVASIYTSSINYSLNDAVSWTVGTPLPYSPYNGPTAHTILSQNRNTGTLLFATTSNEPGITYVSILFRSVDDGLTWTRVYTDPLGISGSSDGPILVIPGSPGVWLVLTSKSVSYISNDDGITWSKHPNNLPNFYVAAFGWNGAKFFIGLQTGSNTFGSLWESSDGITWVQDTSLPYPNGAVTGIFLPSDLTGLHRGWLSKYQAGSVTLSEANMRATLVAQASGRDNAYIQGSAYKMWRGSKSYCFEVEVLVQDVAANQYLHIGFASANFAFSAAFPGYTPANTFQLYRSYGDLQPSGFGSGPVTFGAGDVIGCKLVQSNASQSASTLYFYKNGVLVGSCPNNMPDLVAPCVMSVYQTGVSVRLKVDPEEMSYFEAYDSDHGWHG